MSDDREEQAILLRTLQVGFERTLRDLESKRGNPANEAAILFGTALVEVLRVPSKWIEEMGPIPVLSLDQACNDVLSALEKVLKSTPGSAVPAAALEEGLDDLRAP